MEAYVLCVKVFELPQHDCIANLGGCLRFNPKERFGLRKKLSGLIPLGLDMVEFNGFHIIQWIGLREILQEHPIFNGKIDGFL